MATARALLALLLCHAALAVELNLDYLDPTKLQTKTSPQVQQDTAAAVVARYDSRVDIVVDPLLFKKNKDTFSLLTSNDRLHIRASSGVAALWGYNYYLKKYLKGHISWRVSRVPAPALPDADETVEANDRFRYYQNVCTASYSFLWWDRERWLRHVDWMALNGINLALAPVAQEAAWASVYRKLGVSDDDIERHFTGPAFLAWLRMGNVRGWGGPLPAAWHRRQRDIQAAVTEYMFKLGMVPVLPAFSGHVPRALAPLFPNATFHRVLPWNRFEDDYCCALYLDPAEPLFRRVGAMFLEEVTRASGVGHVYSADPFNEVLLLELSTELVRQAAEAIVAAMRDVDDNAVWLLQNWMFVSDPLVWPRERVQALLAAPPPGRLLVLDLQAEQWPKFQLYDMYFGRPFIWCMLHNFGGTLGMFGNVRRTNADVPAARAASNSTMIGIGLTPEGINQNYVVYELMLETAWRKEPVADLDRWTAEYAERRYGCNGTAAAWRHLLRSVYGDHGEARVRGKYAVTRRPSLRIRPWSWYGSHELIDAWRLFVGAEDCASPGYELDLVDVTRQALQHRADQLYVALRRAAGSDAWAFNVTAARFVDALEDMRRILATNRAFSAAAWLEGARSVDGDAFLYEANARYQITLWGPNGEIGDYACKQWAEMLEHYYIPRWRAFVDAVLSAKLRGQPFDERGAQDAIRATVETAFITADIHFSTDDGEARTVARQLYEKWAFVPGLEELPLITDRPRAPASASPAPPTPEPDQSDESSESEPSVFMLYSSTPTR